jgi:hypothetical protein
MDIMILQRRVQFLLNTGKTDGIWSTRPNSYAFQKFSIDDDNVLHCTRYEIQDSTETLYQSLLHCNISLPIDYKIAGVVSISGTEDGKGVIIVIADTESRNDLGLGDNNNLVLQYFPLMN